MYSLCLLVLKNTLYALISIRLPGSLYANQSGDLMILLRLTPTTSLIIPNAHPISHVRISDSFVCCKDISLECSAQAHHLFQMRLGDFGNAVFLRNTSIPCNPSIRNCKSNCCLKSCSMLAEIHSRSTVIVQVENFEASRQ